MNGFRAIRVAGVAVAGAVAVASASAGCTLLVDSAGLNGGVSGGVDAAATAGGDGSAEASAATDAASVVVAPLFRDDFDARPALAPWLEHLGAHQVNGELVSSALGMFSGALQSIAYLNRSFSDFTVEAKVRFPAGTHGGGLGGRLDTTTGIHYAIWMYPEGSPSASMGGALKLIKFTGWLDWSQVPLAQVDNVGVGTGPHVVALTVRGNRLQVSWDGARVIDYVDSDPMGAPTRGGISVEAWADTPAQAMAVDYVVVTGP